MYECCVEGMKFEEFFEGEVAHTITGMMRVYFVPLQQNLSASGVVQLDKLSLLCKRPLVQTSARPTLWVLI